MRLGRKFAELCRRFAEWLDPTPRTPVDELMPLAREKVYALSGSGLSGSVKWLLTMKSMERGTNARRRHINAAIDRAVLELYGD